MRDLFTVAEFTVKEAVKRKSFIISMIIILLIILIGFNIPNIIDKINNGSNDEKEKVLIIDENNIFGEELISISENSDYEYTMTKQDLTHEEIKQKLENKEYDSCIRFKNDNGKIVIDYIVESLIMGESAPRDLIEKFQEQYTARQIEKSGVTQEQLKTMFTEFEVNSIQTNEKAGTGNIFAMMILSLVLFYAIYFCAYQVSTSITTEKTSKIMETLVTSTSPKTIVLGKTLGIGLVGLFQVIIIAGVAFLSAKTFLPEGMLDNIFDMSNITPSFAIITLVYFILGYASYALLYALTGSMVSKPEDIQSANSPVAILAVIGFYLAYFTMMNPTSGINMFAGIFPISSPFCMPFRILMGSAEIGEIIASIGILLATIIVIAKISIKVYSSAILNYGTKLSLKNIIKIYKTKND